MDTKVIGIGCARSDRLAANVRRALDNLGFRDVAVQRVEQLEEMLELGVILPPALILEDRLVSSGKVPGVSRIEA